MDTEMATEATATVETMSTQEEAELLQDTAVATPVVAVAATPVVETETKPEAATTDSAVTSTSEEHKMVTEEAESSETTRKEEPKEEPKEESKQEPKQAGTSEKTHPALKLNGTLFTCKHDVHQMCKALQAKLKDDEELQGKEAFMIYDLLMYHPTADDKIKTGCTAIAYGVNQEFPDTRSFYLKMEDGTSSAFSVKKCIEAIFPADTERSDKRKRTFETREPEFTTDAGVLMHIEGDGVKALGASAVKEHFNSFNIRFVEFLEDSDGALVRFGDASACNTAVAQASEEIAGVKIVTKLATGDLESGFWKRLEAVVKSKRQKRDQPTEIKFKPGCLLSVSGFPEDIQMSTVKDAFATDERNVRWVEMRDGTAVVRFDSANDAKEACSVMAVDGNFVTVSVATDETEKGFYERMAAALHQKHAGGRGGRGGRGGGGRFNSGRGGGGGGRFNRNDRSGGYKSRRGGGSGGFSKR